MSQRLNRFYVGNVFVTHIVHTDQQPCLDGRFQLLCYNCCLIIVKSATDRQKSMLIFFGVLKWKVFFFYIWNCGQITTFLTLLYGLLNFVWQIMKQGERMLWWGMWTNWWSPLQDIRDHPRKVMSSSTPALRVVSVFGFF